MSLFELAGKITLDTKGYEKGIKNSTQETKKAQSVIEKFSQSVKGLGTKSKIAAIDQKALKIELKDQKEKVKSLSKEYINSARQTGAASKETKKLKQKLDAAKKSVSDLSAELKNSETGFSKFKSNAKNAGKVLGKGALGAAALGGTAIAGMVAGIAKITQSAVQGYAEYEQLVGGVETLFGAGGQSLEDYAKSVGKSTDEASAKYNDLLKSQEIVLQNSDKAFSTAGLSANDYMKTVTGFSASLLQSLDGDTVKAANVADMALIDMSDNANKMGTSMESIQFAYQGFAKQNYTMLDNLKLGYGGTKAEMERLLADAEKLTGKDFDISSYADIIEAIHAVQDEMGITDTTAKEAATTIEGSTNAAKAAFSNLITGLVKDNADFDKLMDDFVKSAGTAGKNIIPRIQKGIEGSGDLIAEGVKILMEHIPSFMEETFPSLLESGTDALKSILSGLTENSDTIADSTLEMIDFLVDSIIDLTPDLLKAGTEILTGFLEGLAERPEDIIDSALDIIDTLVTSLIDNAPEIAKGAFELIVKFIAGIIEKLPDIVDKGEEIIGKIGEGIDKCWEDVKDSGREVINKIKEGIKEKWQGLCDWFNGIWNNLFGNRNANVNVNIHKSTSGDDYGGGGAPFAGGKNYVPYDNYVAKLHKGEMVLTASQAEEYRGGKKSSRPTVIVNQYINAVPMNPVELQDEARYQAKRAVAGFV